MNKSRLWLGILILSVLTFAFSNGAQIRAWAAGRAAPGHPGGSAGVPLPSYLKSDFWKRLHQRAILQVGGGGGSSTGIGAGQQTPKDLDITFFQNTGALNPPSKNPAPGSPLAYSDTEPVFASDQRTVYFASNRPVGAGTAGPFRIWKMNSDGTSQQLVPNTMGSDQQWPAFSADGNNLAYSSRDAQGVAQIHILNFLSAIDAQVTGGPGDKTHPTWSRSNTIAFQDNEINAANPGGLSKIWVVFPLLSPGVDPTTSPRYQLTGVGADAAYLTAIDTQPAWEPSGLHIAFTRNLNSAGSTNRIWLISNVTLATGGGLASSPAFQLTDFSVTNASGTVNSDDQYPTWRPQGSNFTSLTDNPDNDALAFASNRKSDPNPLTALLSGASGVGGTYGIYRVPIDYMDQAQTTPFTETQAQKQTDPVTGTKVKPAVVVTEDVLHPGFAYNNVAPTWSPEQRIDPVTGQQHIANRILYASNSGVPYNLPGGAPFSDIWSSEVIDFTPPALFTPSGQSFSVSATPRLTAPGQPVTVSVHIAELSSGVAHIYAQMKNPNSYLQDTRLPSLRNSIGGNDMFLGFLPNFTFRDPTVAGRGSPVVFDGHRIYQISYLAHPFVFNPVPDAFYRTYNELGYQPIHPQTTMADGTPDPNAYSYADQDANGMAQENLPFDLQTLSSNGLANSIFKPAGGPPNPDLPVTDALELRQDPTDPTLFSATWVTDPGLDTDYIVDIIAVDRVGNAIDYDNIWGFSTKSFPAGASSILLVADYVTPQQFLTPRGALLKGLQFGAESWLTDNPLSKIGTNPVSSGTTTPPASPAGAPSNNVDRLNLVQPGDVTGTPPTSANFLWGFANTLGPGSWINLDRANVPGGPGNYAYLKNLGTNTRTPATENLTAGWPAAENNFNPNTNFDSYDIWRILCRGAVTSNVLAAYGPTPVQVPDPNDITQTVAKLVHNHCVVWDSPFTGDEVVGPGTILDNNTQATIQAFLSSGGHFFLTGQDIAWSLSLGDPNSTVPSHQFLMNNFGVQFANDQVIPLGDPINAQSGPVGGRWSPDNFQGTGGPDSPLQALAHYNLGNGNGLGTEYVNKPNIIQFGDHDQDFVDTVSPFTPTGGNVTPSQEYSQTSGQPNGSVDMVSLSDPTTTGIGLFASFGVEGIDDNFVDLTYSYDAGGGVTQPVKQYASQNQRSILMHGIVDWMRENTISGQVNVLSPTGTLQPLANALVTATQGNNTVALALSRADGSFTLYGIPTGNTATNNITSTGWDPINSALPKAIFRNEGSPGYIVSAVRAGYAQAHALPRITGHFGKPIAVDAGNNVGPLNLLVSQAPPGTITGTVTDASGNPIAGAKVTVSNTPFADIVLTTTTNAQGMYTVLNVPATPTPAPGQPPSTSYIITYSAPGFMSLVKTTDDTTGGPILVPSQTTVVENAVLMVLPTPTNLVAAGGNQQVTLNWTGIATPGATYNVKRSLSATGPFVNIATGVRGTTYIDTGLTNGTTYFYEVTAVTSDGESGPSNVAQATPVAPPDAPGNLRATPGNGIVILNWNPAARAVTYNVKRASVSGGGPTGYVVIATGITGTTFTDTGLTIGTTYFYVVSGTNGAGEGPNSNEASATPVLPPLPPTNLTAAPGSALVVLNWTPDPGTATAPRATSYNVKRSTTPGGPYLLIASGITATTYTDTTVANGLTYYYVVSGVNVSGEGANSNEASATPMAPPAAPANLVATPGKNLITLSWTAAPRAASYNIKRATQSGGPYQTVGTTTTLVNFTDTTVIPGTTYYYVVTGVNVGGEGPPSNEASAAAPTLPGQPTNLVAAAGNSQVTLNWNASPGANTYNIRRSTSPGAFTNGAVIATNLTGTTYTDTGLTQGVTYYYVITGVNLAGEGPPSNEASATPPTPPGATILLTASPKNAQVVLSWNGDPTATSYQVQRATGNGPFAPFATGLTTTTITDTSVVNGTTYFYIVRGVNIGGAGTVSNEAAATPLAPPGAVTGLTATPGPGSITLSWSGAAGASNYNVKRATSPAGPYTTVANNLAATTFTDTGLTPGATYYYIITSVNVGGSTDSTPVSATPPTLPGAPSNLAAVVGLNQAVLTWNAVPGAATYNVKRSTTSGGPYAPLASGLTSPTFTDAPLVAGTSYFYVVSAANAAGEGPNSNEASATPPTPAAVPTNLMAVAGNARVSLTWNAAAGATGYNVKRAAISGGGPTGYTVIATGLTTPAFTDTGGAGGLVNGTTYYYVVSATNAAGESANSNEASATPLAPPPAPTNLAATGGNGQVTLTWTAVAGASGYNVKRSNTSGGPYTNLTPNGVTTNSYTDPGLTKGATYYYVVTAFSAIGESGNSNEASATPPTPPPAPTSLTATPGNGQVSLRWIGTGASGYNVKRSTTPGGPYAALATGVTATTYTDTGITNGTTYYYVVTAVNPGGESPNSNEASATPPLPPSAPTNLTAAAASTNQINLSWTPSGSNITNFQIQRKTPNGAFSQVAQVAGNVTTYQDTTVTGGGTYIYQVIAANVSGASPPSNQASATTPAPPATPVNLAATVGNNGSVVNLSWSDPANDENGFIVERVSGGGTFAPIANVTAPTSTYTDATVSPNVTYSYRIRATNVNGTSGPSNLATVTTGSRLITGTVRISVNGTNQPLPGATVQLLDATGKTVLNSTTTDTSGRYTFSNIQDGAYTVKPASGAAQPAAGVVISVNSSVNNGITTQDFTLSPLNVFQAGLSMVSVPFDYTAIGATAASVFGLPVAGNGSAPIAGFDPVTNMYQIYPTLPGAPTQVRPGYGYWIKENTATPFLTPGAAVSSPYEITLQPGWNIIGDPFLVPLDVNSLQFRVPVQIGSTPANTLLGFQSAAAGQVVGATVYGYSQSTNNYFQATSLQPFQGYWLFVNSGGPNHGPVTLRYTSP